jgi:hypothetical protein
MLNILPFLAASMSWRDTLDFARYALLVGREAECAAFDRALRDDAADVLLVTGSLGMGKTSLLRQFAAQARARGYTPYPVELTERNAPEGLAELRAALHPAHRNSGGDSAPPTERFVLLVDAATAPLAGEVLTRVLPLLPGAARLVVAAPEAPGAHRSDGALQRLVRELPLRPFGGDDSRTLLATLQVPEGCHDALVAFARGQPLALTLAADACVRTGAAAYDPAADADLMATLAARYLDTLPAREIRTALYAATLVRALNEPLLARLLDVQDAYAAFEALRKLPFVRARAGGIALDPLARTVLGADLRWRNADLHAALHRRARAVYAERLAGPPDTDHGTVLSDYLFLLRDNPIVRPFFTLLMQDDGALMAGEGETTAWRATAAAPEHYDAVAALVERHEGPEAARLAAHWLRAQPGSTQVYLDPNGEVAGLLMALALYENGPNAGGDPAVEAVRTYLELRAPLREGERATLFRFWMGADTYQGVSPMLGLIFADTVRHYLTTPRLAVSFLPFAEPDAWGLVMAVAGLPRVLEADFELGTHRYGVFAQDWRRIPPTDWLDRIARFGLTPEPPTAPRIPRRLLDRGDFDEAVRAALRDFTNAAVLGTSALLETRIGARRQAHESPVEALQRMLQEAAAPLARSPRTAKFYRALEATFFDPAPTQEQASERLDVPFSTYRRHLKSGIEAVTETLWARELGAR